MKKVGISEFKAKCHALLERVHATKRPIRVTRFGRPIADIIPPSHAPKPTDWLGFMADTTEIVGDILSPVIGRFNP
jgi:prevent-host-death family protein